MGELGKYGNSTRARILNLNTRCKRDLSVMSSGRCRIFINITTRREKSTFSSSSSSSSIAAVVVKVESVVWPSGKMADVRRASIKRGSTESKITLIQQKTNSWFTCVMFLLLPLKSDTKI